MGNITEYLNKIKTAIYGKEVRGAIHDAIKQVYDDAATEGNTNMEVIIARGKEANLNARLNRMDAVSEENTEQLLAANNSISNLNLKKADLDYVTTLINSIIGGGIKDIYFTLTALEAAFPDGTSGVFLVLNTDTNNNPHMYGWSSAENAWIDLGVYNWNSVGNQTIDKDKLSFLTIETTRGKNLFNKYTVGLDGTYIKWDTGQLLNGAPGFRPSDWIRISPSTTFFINKHYQLSYYDKEKKYISGVNGSGLPLITTSPVNAYYMRVTFASDDIESYQLEVGSVQTKYASYQEFVQPFIKFTVDNILNGDVLIKGTKSVNLLNKEATTDNTYVRWDNGVYGTNDNYKLSDWISIVPGQSIAINFGDQVALSGMDKVYITGFNFNNNPDEPAIFTVPEDCYFLQVSIPKSKLETAQVQIGTKSTDYEKYGSTFVTEENLSNDLVKAVEKAKLLSDNQYKTIQSIFKALWNTKGKKIKFIGDSITAGLGGTGYNTDGEIIYDNYKVNTKGYCWANLLKNYLESKFHCTVKNWGISGRNSYDLLQHISTLVESDDDIVICMVGTNDRNNESRDGNLNSQEGLYNNLLAIAEYVRGLGKEIIFMSSVPASVENETDDKLFHMEDVDTIIMSVAAHYNMEYISLYKKMLNYCDMKDISVDSLLGDGLHPNDEGYLVMFNFVCDALGIGRKRADATW